MPHVDTRPDRLNGKAVRLRVEDGGGDGPPVVLVHGWPLGLEMWRAQAPALARAGLRVVAHDRRGFGGSGRPAHGHDADTHADDLASVLDALDLRGATLVGHSAGAGDVVRYMSRHGGARIARVALVSAPTPYLRAGADNPDGVPAAAIDAMLDALAADRPAFLAAFVRAMYRAGTAAGAGVDTAAGAAAGAGRGEDAGAPAGADAQAGDAAGDALAGRTLRLALAASPVAVAEDLRSLCGTDFRADLLAVEVPALIVHGGADAFLPAEASGDRTALALPDAARLCLDDAPHGLFATHRDALNAALVAFARGR